MIGPLYRSRSIVHFDSALPFPVPFNLSTIGPGECLATEWIEEFNWNYSPWKCIWISHTIFSLSHFRQVELYRSWKVKSEHLEFRTMKQKNHDDTSTHERFRCTSVCAVKQWFGWMQFRPPQHWINFYRLGFGVWKWSMTNTGTTISRIYGFSQCEKRSIKIKETIRIERINGWRRRIVAIIQ